MLRNTSYGFIFCFFLNCLVLVVYRVLGNLRRNELVSFRNKRSMRTGKSNLEDEEYEEEEFSSKKDGTASTGNTKGFSHF